MTRGRRTLIAAALALLVVLSAVLLARGGRARRLAGRARSAVSQFRRELRERRAAEQLQRDGVEEIVGPDARLAVAEEIVGRERGLGPGWLYYGWSPHQIAPGTTPVVDFSGFGGLLVARPDLAGPFGGLLVRYRAPPTYGEFLEVRLEEHDGHVLQRVRLEGARLARDAQGTNEAWIPMRELNPAGKPFGRVAIYAWRKVGSERVQLEALALTGAPPLPPLPPRAATFRLECREPGHEISPLIYGIGTYFVDEGSQQWTLGATARRWGGNHASRYNWKIHAWNMDRDWFFRNSGVRSAESFLAENRDRGVRSALTVPILGWVAKDKVSSSFPISRFGPQRLAAPDSPDAGDGFRPDGTPIRAPPATASVACPPGCVEEWVRSLRLARASGGPGVDVYILDNEPGIWHRTHRDVHPEPLGYDELLSRTIEYARAIRRADPEARIAGPAEWGWLNLFFSAEDVERSTWLRPDRLSHGNTPLLAWYLRRLREHEERTGERLLDVVDVHHYPAQDLGVGLAGPTDPYSAALRIRSTRALWDPSYVDESWIDEPVRLLPRLREWIEENYPGRRISIGEWSYGAEGHMSGGLATAEALGRFGVEGIHSAYYWTYPAARSPAYWAFRAYGNYDGAGARFLDRSVPVSGGARLGSAFASRDGAGTRVVAVLLNHSPRSRLDATLDVGSCGDARRVRVFSYQGGARGLEPADVAPVEGGLFRIEARPYSINVVEVSLAPAPR
jgi:hypothetical protein